MLIQRDRGASQRRAFVAAIPSACNRESVAITAIGHLALLFLPVAECFELRDAMEHLSRRTKAAVKNNWKNARNLITRCTQFER